MPTNVFDKPNEQNEALFNYAMARKRRMKSNSDVPTMKSTTLPMADTMDEYRRSGKGFRGEEDNSLLRRYKQGEHPQMTTPPAYV